MNITHYLETDEIYIFNDPGRARRPLIIVKNGEPLLKEEHISLIKEGELNWKELLDDGVIEFFGCRRRRKCLYCHGVKLSK